LRGELQSEWCLALYAENRRVHHKGHPASVVS
jgi:hypothetical protein